MDKDDMRDNIERAQAEGMVANYRRKYRDVAKAWNEHGPSGVTFDSLPCEAFALRPTIADGEVATCAACVEFGTICRPCRKARYEARRAAERAVERRALRFRVWSSIALGVAVLLLGLFLQARWDAQCAAEQPGTRWNGDLWACEVAR